jgi:hypothetical protein
VHGLNSLGGSQIKFVAATFCPSFNNERVLKIGFAFTTLDRREIEGKKEISGRAESLRNNHPKALDLKPEFFPFVKLMRQSHLQETRERAERHLNT